MLRPLIFCLLLAGCSTPYRPPLLVDAHTTFPGLIDLAAQANGHAADVLLVHGICTHDAGWAGVVVQQLAQALRDATASAPPRLAGGAAVEIVPSVIDTPAGRLRCASMR